jgi:hypothetical protein
MPFLMLVEAGAVELAFAKLTNAAQLKLRLW